MSSGTIRSVCTHPDRAGGFDPENIYVLSGNGTDWECLAPGSGGALVRPQVRHDGGRLHYLDSVRTVFRALASGNGMNGH